MRLSILQITTPDIYLTLCLYDSRHRPFHPPGICYEIDTSLELLQDMSNLAFPKELCSTFSLSFLPYIDE